MVLRSCLVVACGCAVLWAAGCGDDDGGGGRDDARPGADDAATSDATPGSSHDGGLVIDAGLDAGLDATIGCPDADGDTVCDDVDGCPGADDRLDGDGD